MSNEYVQNVNPLLEKIKLPGRIFRIPSRGAFYNNGEISDDAKQNDGEVHIHAMTAIDEINLKNPDMLFSGKAVEAVFASCIPAIRKPLELFGRDIDALLLFLRMVTYGPQFDITAQHVCDGAKEHDYTVNLETIAGKIVELDPTTVNDKFIITLDNGQKITLNPTRYKDIIASLQNIDPKKKISADEMKVMLFNNLIMVINNVDGITDKKMINEWLRALKAPDINLIADSIDVSNQWGIDFTTELECKDCATKFKVDLPVNPISFFSD